MPKRSAARRYPAPSLMRSVTPIAVGENGRSAYVIAGAKRCGSSHLCAMLNNTGLLGRPEEYFHPDRLPWSAMRSKALAVEAWNEIAHHAATPNGVLGFKIFYSHFARACVRRFVPALADMEYVLLTRLDRLAQAVSLARAIQTQSWSSHQPEQRRPFYSSRLIGNCLQAIEQDMAGWEEFFRANAIEPLHVTYEDLTADSAAAVAAVARHVGVEPSCLPPLQSCKQIQRDAINRLWQERFLAESIP